MRRWQAGKVEIPATSGSKTLFSGGELIEFAWIMLVCYEIG